MAIAGTTIPLDSAEGMDKITTTEKVTTPYFSDGATDLLAVSIVSSSLTDTNENYFFGVSHTDTPTTEEFNVTFGSTNGYGTSTPTNKKARTEAIYKQFASMLLAPTEVTGGFIISSAATGTGEYGAALTSGKDSEIFVLTSRRTNTKDRLNKGNWTIQFSGSTPTAGGHVGSAILSLTDDSVNKTPTASPVGDRYNIVSGSDGTVHTAAATRNFGYYYPSVGVMVFSEHELSQSIPGASDSTHAIKFNSASQAGFAVPHTTTDSKQALRFINCLTSVGDANGTGAKLSFRDEEDQVSAQYFCRVRAAHANFSNNPTFVSGSQNKLRATKMNGNPQTFITGVQLYNDNNDIVAVANLSTPLKKNFSSEATIKVKLTY